MLVLVQMLIKTQIKWNYGLITYVGGYTGAAGGSDVGRSVGFSVGASLEY